jgi:hypothetical protein
MALKIQVEVYWAVTPHSTVGGYHLFREPYCLPEDGGSKVLKKYRP